MKNSAVVFILCLFHVPQLLGFPGPGPSTFVVASKPVTTDLMCRDFTTVTDLSLSICDFVMTDKLKTELLSLIITEQKSIDILIKDSTTSDEEKKRLTILKNNLVNIEHFAVQKITDICNLKGRIIKEGANLVSGCTYNQFKKIKKDLLLIKKPLSFISTESQWPAIEEQVKFDTFINDLLLDLAEKNKQEQDNNAQIKVLMLEILKIYGGNGLSLYSAFWGICGLETIVKTNNGVPVDHDSAVQCEEKYLSDLRQVLFLAI